MFDSNSFSNDGLTIDEIKMLFSSSKKIQMKDNKDNIDNKISFLFKKEMKQLEDIK